MIKNNLVFSQIKSKTVDLDCNVQHQFSQFYLFATVKYNINYNNNNTLGRQSKKPYAYLKDCFKKWSKKLECKLSLAEQKY